MINKKYLFWAGLLWFAYLTFNLIITDNLQSLLSKEILVAFASILALILIFIGRPKK